MANLENCSACEDLKTYAPDFVVNGITNATCKSLGNDTGLNPALNPRHNNCQDLQDMSDCLIGALGETLPSYDICDIKDYLGKLTNNLKSMFDALACNECGQWNMIWKLYNSVVSIVGGEEYHFATQLVFFDVPKEQFVQVGAGLSREVWFSGDPAHENEYWVDLEMDIAEHVVIVPYAMLGGEHPTTITFQQMVQQGKRAQINFDIYQVQGATRPDTPVPFDQRVYAYIFGKKKVVQP